MKMIKKKEIVNIDKVDKILCKNDDIDSIVICNQVYKVKEVNTNMIKQHIYELAEPCSFNTLYLVFEYDGETKKLIIIHRPFIGSA